MILQLALAIALDSATTARRFVLAPAESIQTTAIGGGRPVVFIAGMLGSGYTYRKVIPLLVEQGYHVIVVEPLGTGGSSFPEKADYSLTSQANRMGQVLDSLGVGKALLVGQGMGGSIALRMAYRRPEQVSGVLLVDSGISEAAASPGMRGAAKFAGLLRIFIGAGTIRKRVTKDMRANAADTSWVTPDLVNEYIAGQARDLDATIDVIKGMVRSKEPESLYDHLDVYQGPVHFLVGAVAHPTSLPDSELVMLRSRIRHFSLDSVAGAAQYIQEENPARVLDAVEWLEPQAHLAPQHPWGAVH